MQLSLGIQGIGGMNGFSAGALYYLRTKTNIKPDLVSITSGAIMTFFHYLDSDPEKLKEMFYTEAQERLNQEVYSPFIHPDYAKIAQFYKLALFGIPGVFRSKTLFDRLDEFREMDISTFMDPSQWIKMMFPSAIYEKTMPKSVYQEIADCFNASDIGIITNAYNYKTGKAIVYVNQAASDALRGSRFEIDSQSDSFEIQPITSDGIAACLQLIQYGPYNDQYDGAYQYNPVIPPLKKAQDVMLITVVPISRPLKPIDHYFDIEDFKLKMMFVNAISSELASTELINQFIDQGIITDESIKKTNLHLIEPEMVKGYFDYFRGDPKMFEHGYQQAEEVLKNWNS